MAAAAHGEICEDASIATHYTRDAAMKTQKSEILFRIATAVMVALLMALTVHGLAGVSQWHIEQTLARYNAMEQTQAVQLAQGVPDKRG